MKISIVGMGRVGSATAFALVTRAIPHELVLVGRSREKVLGDVHDLQDAAALSRLIQVRAGGFEECAGSDIVLIAASVAARRPRRPPGGGRRQRAA